MKSPDRVELELMLGGIDLTKSVDSIRQEATAAVALIGQVQRIMFFTHDPESELTPRRSYDGMVVMTPADFDALRIVVSRWLKVVNGGN